MLASLALAAHLGCAVMVKPGDTLSSIATAHHTTWTAVYAGNRATVGGNPNLIYPGETLVLCEGKSSGPVLLRVDPGVVFHNDPVTPRTLPFCNSMSMWPGGTPFLWETPVGCYSGVYWAGNGDCFGWVRRLMPNIAYLTAHRVPMARSAVHIPPGMEGASSAGHWAYVIAVRGRWALISEENMYWRGGGYNRVTYRYLLLEPGMLYYY